MLLSLSALVSLALPCPLPTPATPDVSSFDSCGTIVQDGACLVFVDDAGLSYEIVQSIPYQPGDRVYVAGLYGTTTTSCASGVTRQIVADPPATFSPDCHRESFCGCYSTSACGNEGAQGEQNQLHGCANSHFTDGATLDGGGPTPRHSSFSGDTLTLGIRNAVPNQTVIFLVSDRVQRSVVGDGLYCVGGGPGPMLRVGPFTSDASGRVTVPNALSAIGSLFPNATWIQPGAPVFVQAAYRDPNGPCGSGFNFTPAWMVVPAI